MMKCNKKRRQRRSTSTKMVSLWKKISRRSTVAPLGARVGEVKESIPLLLKSLSVLHVT